MIARISGGIHQPFDVSLLLVGEIGEEQMLAPTC